MEIKGEGANKTKGNRDKRNINEEWKMEKEKGQEIIAEKKSERTGKDVEREKEDIRRGNERGKGRDAKGKIRGKK